MRGTASPKTSVGVNLKMVSVNEVCQVLQQLAPLSSEESWDNVGLLLGRAERPVNRIMTCLTLTPNVAFEAIGRNVQMIVTHHPVMFRAVKSITGETLEGRLLLDLIEAGIAVYSPHTAFDNADEGINQWLAESFGLALIEPLRQFAAGSPGGSGPRRGPLGCSWGPWPREQPRGPQRECGGAGQADVVRRAKTRKPRTERRLGEVLAAMPKDAGGRPANTGTEVEPVSKPAP